MYSPSRVALAGIGAWLFFWLITPVYATLALDPTALFFIAVCYGGFFLGCTSYSVVTGKNELTVPASDWQNPTAYGLFWLSLALGLAGMGLRLYDRVALRGVDYAGGATDFRETLSQVSAGPLSAVAAILFPFCLVPLVVLLASKFRARQIPLYILSIVTFFLPTIESLAQSSRSVMLMSAGLAFAAITCAKFRGKASNWKLIATTLVAIVSLAILSTIIFTSRLGETDRRLSDSVITSAYADNLQPTEQAWRGLVSGSELESRYYSIILPNGMYYLSGLYEFSSLWNRPDPQPFSYGGYNAIAFVRTAQLVLSPNSEPLNEAELVYKPGVFQTFFGNAWVDFGYFAPLFLFALGFGTSALSSTARSGNLSAMPLYLYFVVVIFFMPVGNMINGGLGNYILASFSLIALVGPRNVGRRPEQRPAGPEPASYRADGAALAQRPD